MKKTLLGTLLAACCMVPAMAGPSQQGAVIALDDILIGGWQNGKWIGAEPLAKQPEYLSLLRLEDPYRVFSHGKELARGMPKLIPENGPEPFLLQVKLPEGKKASEDTVPLSTNAAWNPFPRQGSWLNPSHAVYSKVLQDHLAKRGIRGCKSMVRQILKVDLNGDGADEVLITGACVKDAGTMNWKPGERLGGGRGTTFHANKSDLAIVLLRSVEPGGKGVSERVLYEFQGSAAQDGPNYVAKIHSVADLNGDGSLEIILEADYYEGYWFQVHEFRGDPTDVKLLNGFMV